MARIIRLKEARNDLKSLFKHISKTNSESVATNYLQEIEVVFGLLSGNPKAGRQRIELRDDLRSFPTQSHVIFYTIRDENIVILRVLHASMDHPECF